MPPDERHDDLEVFHEGVNQSHRGPSLKAISSAADRAKSVDSASLLQNASSIQSMLRNTTETNGVGHFSQSQRQASSPRSGRTPKISPRPRVGSKNFSPTLPRRHQESRPGSGRSTPTVPRYGLSSQLPGPDAHSRSPLSYQEPTRSMSVEEYRTFTTSQSSYIAHNPNSRHPYVQNARHQNRGQMQRVRPRSPFAYPTRLKRPGYRPSSPALSLNRSIHSADLDRGNGSRTASPASMYHMNRVPTPWQQVVNRSDPTLRYYPPVQGLPSSRGSTPKPAPSVGSIASSIRLSQVAVQYPGAWPVSPAVTPPPLFYDYSEAFQEQTEAAEQTRIHRISVSIVTSPVTRADEDQIRYWEYPQNTESEVLVELPSAGLPAPIVELNVFRSNGSRPQSMSGRQQEQEDSAPVPQMKPIEIFDPSPPDLDTPISHSSSPKTKENKQEKHATPLRHADEASSFDTQQQASKDPKDPKLDGPSNTGHPETTGEPCDPEQDDSSPIASMSSVQSSVQGEILEDSTEPTSGADTADASPDGPPRTPINHSHSTDCLCQPPENQETKSSKNSTPVESNSIQYPEIVAPTPERSIISLSNRERFSKILGLDQGLHELDSIATSSRRHEGTASYSMDRVLKNDETFQRCLSPTPATRNSISEKNEVNDSTQSTYGLMETFERSNGSGYEMSARKSSSLSPHPANESSRPSTLRESPKWGTSTPSNVRLSHRRIVINAGQTIETKNENVHKPSTIFEYQAQEINNGSSPKKMLLTHNDDDAPTPPLSVKAFAPPEGSPQSDLPFAFTPLIQPPSEDESSVDLETPSPGLLKAQESQKRSVETALPISDTDMERFSTASPAASRPWNLDTSYPWEDNEPPKLDVVMPLRERDSQQSGEKFPKFKLRIHRASSSTASKLTKKNRSSEDTMSSVIASSVDLLKSASFRRTQKPRPSVGPGDCNSSHDIIRTSPLQTRFIESFEQPSLGSPVISLMPPSPALDVRSFFSDDSSQARQKGSLRKRFSDFRTRNSRANSVDHGPGYDRGILNSTFGLSRASGRSSRQSQTATVAPSPGFSSGCLRWTIVTRLRAWFSRRENDIREWKRKKSTVTQADNPQLYAGV